MKNTLFNERTRVRQIYKYIYRGVQSEFRLYRMKIENEYLIRYFVNKNKFLS